MTIAADIAGTRTDVRERLVAWVPAEIEARRATLAEQADRLDGSGNPAHAVLLQVLRFEIAVIDRLRANDEAIERIRVARRKADGRLRATILASRPTGLAQVPEPAASLYDVANRLDHLVEIENGRFGPEDIDLLDAAEAERFVPGSFLATVRSALRVGRDRGLRAGRAFRNRLKAIQDAEDLSRDLGVDGRSRRVAMRAMLGDRLDRHVRETVDALLGPDRTAARLLAEALSLLGPDGSPLPVLREAEATHLGMRPVEFLPTKVAAAWTLVDVAAGFRKGLSHVGPFLERIVRAKDPEVLVGAIVDARAELGRVTMPDVGATPVREFYRPDPLLSMQYEDVHQAGSAAERASFASDGISTPKIADGTMRKTRFSPSAIIDPLTGKP